MRSFPPEFRLRAVGECAWKRDARQLRWPRLLDISMQHLQQLDVELSQGWRRRRALFRSSATPRGVAEGTAAPARARPRTDRRSSSRPTWDGGTAHRPGAAPLFLLPASPETVRRQLAQGRADAPTSSPSSQAQSRPSRASSSGPPPTRCGRADIFTFRLGGRNAYLIAFMDDYSRYIVGGGAVPQPDRRRPSSRFTAGRRRVSGRPRRCSPTTAGNTPAGAASRFQKELAKDRVHHIRSRPHHPMTLGKVERFWKTIWSEFLGRAQFDDFEAGPGAHPAVGQVLQPQAPPPGHRRHVPGGPLLRDPARAAQDHRGRASRKTSWKWPCAAGRKPPSTWSGACRGSPSC